MTLSTEPAGAPTAPSAAKPRFAYAIATALGTGYLKPGPGTWGSLFGLLVASGVATWFAFQSFVNIGMTIGIMPITGIPLPFMSYGGSAIFTDFASLGVLLNIYNQKDRNVLGNA